MSYLAMPHRTGWAVLYRIERTFPARNGKPEYTKLVDDSCYFATKEAADRAAEALKAKGAEIRMVTEAIY